MKKLIALSTLEVHQESWPSRKCLRTSSQAACMTLKRTHRKLQPLEPPSCLSKRPILTTLERSSFDRISLIFSLQRKPCLFCLDIQIDLAANLTIQFSESTQKHSKSTSLRTIKSICKTAIQSKYRTVSMLLIVIQVSCSIDQEYRLMQLK